MTTSERMSKNALAGSDAVSQSRQRSSVGGFHQSVHSGVHSTQGQPELECYQSADSKVEWETSTAVLQQTGAPVEAGAGSGNSDPAANEGPERRGAPISPDPLDQQKNESAVSQQQLKAMNARQPEAEAAAGDKEQLRRDPTRGLEAEEERISLEIERKVDLALRSALKSVRPEGAGALKAADTTKKEEDRVLEKLREQLNSPDLRKLAKRDALAIASKRVARNLRNDLWESHVNAQRDRCKRLKRRHRLGDDTSGNSCSDMSDSDCSLATSDSDNSAQRGRHNRGAMYPSPAARASALAQPQHSGIAAAAPASVVVVGNSKLPIWKAGAESNLQGFNWRTKNYIYHQWEQYMLAEGQYAPKEFKSLIAQDLIPVICAETGLRAQDWAFLSDGEVIAKIDRALRPTRSTDFALQLQGITLTTGKPGTLLQRYRFFAERFLAKVAEAQAAERPIKDNVVKDAFKDATKMEGVLKMWLREVDWRGVDKAHRRLMRKLKESHSWDKLRDDNERKGAKWRRMEEEDQIPRRFQRRENGAAHVALAEKEQPEVCYAASRNPRNIKAEDKKFYKAKRPSQSPQNIPLRQHPGLDQRGASWHMSTEQTDCRNNPCGSRWCQRCAQHGHTADECKKPDDTPGLNLKGYYQENKGKNAGPVRGGGPKPNLAVHVQNNVAAKRGRVVEITRNSSQPDRRHDAESDGD